MRLSGKVKILFFIFLTAFPFAAYSQFVLGGSNPAKQRWMQVGGNIYDVIYPAGMDSLAKRYLWLLERNNADVMLGLNSIRPKRMPVVLNNRTVLGNGTVVWAPRRVELYTIPPGTTYPQRWEEQLVLHELRHVGQMSWFTKGVYGAGEYILGEQSPSLGAWAFGNRWFLEGDAVVAETELTGTGRGRNAEFMEYYRMAALEGEKRSWERWRLGSYKYYTPDLYPFGYLLGSTIRYRYNNYNYAGEILEQIAKKGYSPLAKHRSYMKVTGSTPRLLFARGQQLMDSIWRSELAGRGTFTNPQKMLEAGGKGYQEYLSPLPVGNDSILYLKYSYRKPMQLVLIADGKESVLCGFSQRVKGFSGHGEHIYFTESIPHPRWSNVVYGQLYSYDWKRGKLEKLSGKTYYGSPYVSDGGDTLLVEEYFPDGGSVLNLLSAEDGRILHTIPAPENGQVTESIVVGDVIYALAITEDGLGLYRVSIGGSGDWETVIAPQLASITHLHAGNGLLGFVSDIDGVRNVYMYDPNRNRLGRITNSRYGASEPRIANGVLYYSSLEMGGKMPVKTELGQFREKALKYDPVFGNGKLESSYRYVVADRLSQQAHEAQQQNRQLEKDMPESSSVPDAVPRRYSKAGNLFRFHSWAPVYYNVDKIISYDYDNLYEVLAPGVTAYSQNTLGTAVTMLGYSYRKGLHAGHFRFGYTGWFPAFEISADINEDDRFRVRFGGGDTSARHIVEKLSSPLVDVTAQMYIPLDLSGHGWYNSIIPQVMWEFSNNGYYDEGKKDYIYPNILTAALQMSRIREMSHSDVFPQWGVGAVAKWRTAIGGGNNFGSSESVYLYGYVPGFADVHGIKWSLGMQRQHVAGKRYYMDNMVDMPRGYSDDVWGEKYFMGTLDYAFPVYLGDFHIWKLGYFKRMRVIPFADYAIMERVVDNRGTRKKSELYSYGVDMMFDMAPFLINFDFSIGLRYARNGNNANLPVRKNSFEVILSTSLF